MNKPNNDEVGAWFDLIRVVLIIYLFEFVFFYSCDTNHKLNEEPLTVQEPMETQEDLEDWEECKKKVVELYKSEELKKKARMNVHNENRN